MKTIFAGLLFAMAYLSATGTGIGGQIATAWGNNQYDQLGLGTYAADSYIEPERVPEDYMEDTLTNVTKISCGGFHTLALMEDHTVRAWGAGALGQLGQGPLDLDNKEYATPVKNVSNMVEVEAGGNHSLALRDDGMLAVWGNNTSGQLGTGDRIPRPTPVLIAGFSDTTQLVCGANFSMALKTNGRVRACGNNLFGQLGFGDTNSVLSFTEIPGLSNVAAVGCGDSHAAAVLGDGTVMTWGNNRYGQLGLGHTNSMNQPQLVPGVANARAVVCGSFHTLVLLYDGTVMSCGNNMLGQCGAGDHTNHHVFVPVASGLSQVEILGAGADFSLARCSDGTVYSWGDNITGQLGLGLIVAYTNPYPQKIPRLGGVQGVDAGNIHALSWGQETPILRVTPRMLDFGFVKIGESEIEAFTVQNIGFGYLYVDASVPAPFEIMWDPIPPLYDEAYGEVAVRFTPPAPLAYSNNVTITANGTPSLWPVIGHGWVPHFRMRWQSESNQVYQVRSAPVMASDASSIWRADVDATAPTNTLTWTNAPNPLAVFWIEASGGAAPDITAMEYITE